MPISQRVESLKCDFCKSMLSSLYLWQMVVLIDGHNCLNDKVFRQVFAFKQLIFLSSFVVYIWLLWLGFVVGGITMLVPLAVAYWLLWLGFALGWISMLESLLTDFRELCDFFAPITPDDLKKLKWKLVWINLMIYSASRKS